MAVVTWSDTTHIPGWHNEDEIEKEPMKMETAGWLVSDNDESVVMAMTVGKFKIGDYLIIPKLCVISVNVIE